jgi:hypothetical protein
MKQFASLVLLALMSDTASALFIWGPHGAVDVEQTSYGFTMTSLSGKGITSVSRTATGYVIVPPDEPATFVDFENDRGWNEELLVPSMLFPLLDEEVN